LIAEAIQARNPIIAPGEVGMTMIFIGVMCVAALVVGAGLLAVAILLARAGDRDSVSSAREDWIERRSDKDRREW
jgi:hypothetical protein